MVYHSYLIMQKIRSENRIFHMLQPNTAVKKTLIMPRRKRKYKQKLQIVRGEPTEEGIKEAIIHRRNGATPGSYNIPTNFWKMDTVNSSNLISKIWTKEEIPKEQINEI